MLSFLQVLFSADLKKFQDLKSGQDSKQIKEVSKHMEIA